MAFVSLSAVYVSAVNNLGWVMAGHDLAGLFSVMGNLLPGPLYHGYQFFLAVLLPLAVGAIALVPLDHFFQHALEQDHLDNHALQVDERHMHRTAYLKAQKKQRKEIEAAYEEVAEDRAQTFIEDVRNGDMSFGSGRLQLPQPTIVTSNVVQQLPAQGATTPGRVWPASTQNP